MSRARTIRKKKVLKAGRWLRLVSDGGWEYVERVNATGVVALVAVTAAGKMILTEQLRRSVAARVIDLPAGLAGDGDDTRTEDLAAAARRELVEETGYDARRFELLADVPTSPGLTSEVVTFFRAVSPNKVGAGGGIAGEAIRVHHVKLAAVDAWLQRRVRAGVQIDCKVYAGLYFASGKRRCGR